MLERNIIQSRNRFITAILPVTLMALLTVIIYSNAIHCAFIFDDHHYITEDPAIRITTLTFEKIINAAINGKPEHRLLPNISFAINYYFGRYKVEGYHLTNIVIHLFTGICLFFFFRTTLAISLTSRCNLNQQGLKYPSITTTSMLSACLWLAHPVQTEAVTYIVQRMTSMVALFYILSLLLYIFGRKNWKSGQTARAWIYFTGCIAAGLCAIACKENSATLPVMILLYEWFFFKERKADGSKKHMLWFLAAIVFIGAMALIYLGKNPFHRILSPYLLREFSLPQRVMTEFRVLIYYVSLLFFPRPARLMLDYDYPLSNAMIHPLTTALSLTAIIALILLSVYLARKKYYLESFCILWFFITLLIESSVIPIEIIYEHRLYLASTMPLLLFCWVLTRYIRPKWFVVLIICIFIGQCGVWTYQRNQTWRNPVTFWKDNLKKTPGDSRVLNNLGDSLMHSGKTEQAIKYFKKSIELRYSSRFTRMNIINPINNLGTAYIRLNKYEKAIETLQTAIQFKPLDAETHTNIAIAFQGINQYDQAIRHYKKALEIDPESYNALSGLGYISLKKGNPDRAIHYLKKAISIEAENSTLYITLARAYMERRNYDNAILTCKRALEIAPGNDVLRVTLGNAYAQGGRFTEAVNSYQKAIRSNPENKNAYFSLAIAYAMQKKYEKAVNVFEQMLLHWPNNSNIYYNIGCLKSLANQTTEAIAWLQKAVTHGYTNWEHIASDPDLKNIRKSKAYQVLITSVKKVVRPKDPPVHKKP